MKKDGGPAFPTMNERLDMPRGMTLRDYFAAAAMKGSLASGSSEAADFNPEWEGYKGGIPEEFATVAQEAYLMADAMLAERDKAG